MTREDTASGRVNRRSGFDEMQYRVEGTAAYVPARVATGRTRVKRKTAAKTIDRNRAKALSMSRSYVVFLAIISAATVIMCVRYLKLKETITAQNHVVEQLEVQLRTQITYCLSIKYGPEGYSDVRNFNDKKNYDGRSIHGTIMDSFKNEVKHCKNLPFVKHHQDVYGGHFPIWAAVELMTFGNITSIFDIMKPEDQKSISSFYGTSPNHLKSWMLALVEIRNICAHYNRLYNMPLKQTPFLYKENLKYRSKQNK